MRVKTKQAISMRKLANYIWGLLLFLILAFPRMLSTPKTLLCLLMIVVGCVMGSIRINKDFINLLLLWFVYSLGTTIIGLVFQNAMSGILAFAKVNILNALLWFALLFVVRKFDVVGTTIRIVTFVGIYIGIYNLLLLVERLSNAGITFLYQLDRTAMVGLHTGYVHITSTNISMCMFIFPILLFSITDNYVGGFVDKRIRYLAVLLSGTALIISGRRILWIIVIFAFFAWCLHYLKNEKFYNRSIVGILIFIVMAVVVGGVAIDRIEWVSWEGIINRFLDAFRAYDEYGNANTRILQSKNLINGFLNHMFIGNGAGAMTTYSGVASGETSSFELSYHVVLFQSGIIGMTIYLAYLLLTIRVSKKQGKRISKTYGFMVATTLIVVIIANATNPYFSSSFDFQSFLFLPMMLISAIECKSNCQVQENGEISIV